MKKGIILIAFFAMGTMVSSCGKDYTCICENDDGKVVSQLEIDNSTKEDAEEECENFETTGESCKLE